MLTIEFIERYVDDEDGRIKYQWLLDRYGDVDDLPIHAGDHLALALPDRTDTREFTVLSRSWLLHGHSAPVLRLICEAAHSLYHDDGERPNG